MNFALGTHPETGLAHLTIYDDRPPIRPDCPCLDWQHDPSCPNFNGKQAVREERRAILLAAEFYDNHAKRLEMDAINLRRLASNAREAAEKLTERN